MMLHRHFGRGRRKIEIDKIEGAERKLRGRMEGLCTLRLCCAVHRGAKPCHWRRILSQSRASTIFQVKIDISKTAENCQEPKKLGIQFPDLHLITKYDRGVAAKLASLMFIDYSLPRNRRNHPNPLKIPQDLKDTLSRIDMSMPAHRSCLISTEIYILRPSQSSISGGEDSFNITELLVHEIVLLCQLFPGIYYFGSLSPFYEGEFLADFT